MTTPAGWYDDGSGRQRWWDGQQWTEHFAPETAAPIEDAAPAESAPSEPDVAAVDEPSIDDTVVRVDETVINPDSGHDVSAQPEAALPDASYPATTSFTAPAAPAAPTYGAPAAPQYPGAASAQPTGAYPGSYTQGAGGYPAADPYAAGAPAEPKKISVLGLVGLGLSVIGTIVVFIPLIGFIGFFVLAAGFIVSLISLFLKGKKWPGIAGLSLAVVGTILGVVMSFVYLFAFAQGVSEEYNGPSSSATAEATPVPEESGAPDDGTVSGARPTAEEVAVGLTAIFNTTAGDAYTDAQMLCLANAFVASDLADETLRAIADSDGTLTDMAAASGVAEVLSDTDMVTSCLAG
ncbi:hypothetical protein SRABI76_01016 [Microbacterium oxydans]|uniref:DUF2510 domain-containing protein n=1 Tax=Microbacterium oxydans TaxID=82380 RepID=A0A0F0L738_9MICO|nr:DUF2510 domain-containing protein [Microbacterium oxydans]KJL28997.1 hypothetical protein RS83_02480 [Microbacterium oxydans]CAH0160192.1 hypothetical protein SRABI76_01016 [Microbacterium oxydans]